ncbi:MAG: zinc ABC transporter substrate-binding protein [Gammaproteobacteria bacterium]|nr:zinc ABC transporter substrate-binding protein [Gammaproteobacteria bacterium]
MKKSLLLMCFLGIAPGLANAEMSVFACEPEWAALASELGGDLLKVESATTGMQDPHYIQARPSLIARVRRANLVLCTGADLEVGWLPLLLRQANNGKVQVGQSGFLAAADFVSLLEKPEVLDRAAGDIHPFGNPHIQMDPRNFSLVAAELNRRLQALDPANAPVYELRYKDFDARWSVATEGWSARMQHLQGTKLVTYHRSWVYLFAWAGLEEVGTLEPKPGVPPSSSYLSELLVRLKGQDIRGIVHASYQDSRPSEWLSERTRFPVLLLPHTVGSMSQVTDLFSMFEVLVSTLEKAAK